MYLVYSKEYLCMIKKQHKYAAFLSFIAITQNAGSVILSPSEARWATAYTLLPSTQRWLDI